MDPRPVKNDESQGVRTAGGWRFQPLHASLLAEHAKPPRNCIEPKLFGLNIFDRKATPDGFNPVRFLSRGNLLCNVRPVDAIELSLEVIPTPNCDLLYIPLSWPSVSPSPIIFGKNVRDRLKMTLQILVLRMHSLSTTHRIASRCGIRNRISAR